MNRTSVSLGLALLLVGVAGGLAPVGAASETIVIAGGVRGRTYADVYAVNLARLLRSFKVRQQETKGSGENLDLLANRRADVGFAQIDAYAARLRHDRSRYGGIQIIGRLAAECVFVAYRRAGPVTDLSGLRTAVGDRKPIVAIGESEGGMHETWLSLKARDPSFDAAAVRFTAGTLAINHLAAGLVDAVAWVTDPSNEDHKLLRAVQADDSLGLFGLGDASLAYELPDGAPVYQIREVSPSAKPFADQFETLCTHSMLFARPDAAPEIVDAVSDVLSLQREELVNRQR